MSTFEKASQVRSRVGEALRGSRPMDGEISLGTLACSLGIPQKSFLEGQAALFDIREETARTTVGNRLQVHHAAHENEMQDSSPKTNLATYETLYMLGQAANSSESVVKTLLQGEHGRTLDSAARRYPQLSQIRESGLKTGSLDEADVAMIEEALFQIAGGMHPHTQRALSGFTPQNFR